MNKRTVKREELDGQLLHERELDEIPQVSPAGVPASSPVIPKTTREAIEMDEQTRIVSAMNVIQEALERYRCRITPIGWDIEATDEEGEPVVTPKEADDDNRLRWTGRDR